MSSEIAPAQPATATPTLPTLFGQIGWPNLVAQFGAIAVLMWLVVYQMPAEQKACRQELTDIHQQHSADMKELAKSLSANAKATRDLVEEVRLLKGGKAGG